MSKRQRPTDHFPDFYEMEQKNLATKCPQYAKQPGSVSSPQKTPFRAFFSTHAIFPNNSRYCHYDERAHVSWFNWPSFFFYVHLLEYFLEWTILLNQKRQYCCVVGKSETFLHWVIISNEVFLRESQICFEKSHPQEFEKFSDSIEIWLSFRTSSEVILLTSNYI